MQTANYFKTFTSVAVFGAALSVSVLAQPGPGPGPGPNSQGMRHMRVDQANTPGWTLMTTPERMAHRNQMREANTYEECQQIQTEHHAAMEARAKEKGLTLRAPRQNICDMAKARGWVK